MTEPFHVANALRLAILLALMGLAFLVYQLPDKIGREMPGSCGSNYNPCKIEGSIDLRDATISDLKSSLKADFPSIPEPCGRRSNPCWVYIQQ